MDQTGKAQYIAWIRGLPQQLRALVEGLDEQQLTTRFLDGEWSVAQNVHHLADTNMNVFMRIKMALTEDRPTVASFDQDKWADTAEAHGMPIEPSLVLLDGLQERWASLAETLSDEQLARSVVSPLYGESTIGDILRLYSRHGLNHLDQIRETLAAQG
ncbi:MAG: DinB family protein [Anaerolineaceae bacterium]|nr:DinB family protein [Anaerolineaceae bacterium]